MFLSDVTFQMNSFILDMNDISDETDYHFLFVVYGYAISLNCDWNYAI